MASRFAARGTKRANDSLSRYFDNIKQWTDVSDTIFGYLQKKTREAFDNRGRGGHSWPDYWKHEPKYGMKKLGIFIDNNKKSMFPRLLRWLPGREWLFPSLMIPSHPDAVRKVTDEGLEYGTSVKYASDHQYGRGKNKQGEPIQQRKFLVITARDVAEIRRIISRQVGI